MLKRFLSMAAVLVGIAATGTASATLLTYQDSLSPEAVGATGSGTVTLQFDTVTHDLTVGVIFAGLSTPTIAAHIHCCTAVPGTGTAAVVVDSPSILGFPLGVTGGTYWNVFDLDDPLNFTPAFVAANGGTAAGAIARLLLGFDTGSAYFNIHTSRFPGGEIRGFPTAIPEPASLALFGLGLAGFAFSRRRR